MAADILHTTNSVMWGAAMERGDSYEERVKNRCRVKGTRMDMILSAIEKGRTNEQIVRLCQKWNQRHNRPIDVTEADAAVFDVYRKVLNNELTQGVSSDKMNARIETKINSNGKKYGMKSISEPRAIRTAITQRRIREGESLEDVARELRINHSTIFHYVEDYDTDAIGCVTVKNGYMPWNKWLLDNGFEDLIK